VPENRQSSSGSIQLAVVIIHSIAEHPAPDPVVYLAGGPGGSSTAYTEGLAQTWLRPFLRQRDVILVDQRGTGASTPNLACDEYSRVIIDQISVLPPSARAMLQAQAAALTACHERLAAQGIDTSAYTSAESAADLDDLRQALHIESWNLLGVSYGTRLALTALRDHPTGIRSVILDSVYPPQVDVFTDVYANGERARQMVFAACANDPACAAAYPDLEARFWQLIARLNASPVTVSAQINGRERDFVWAGDVVYSIMFLWLYDIHDTTFVPYYVDLLWQGKYDDQSLLRAALDAELWTISVSVGMYMSVQCGEERPASLAEERRALFHTYPRLTSLLRHDLWMSDLGDAMCRQWQPTPPPVLENQPIVSDVPALVLSGTFDPITPPAWAVLAAETLPQAQILTIPEIGHGVIRSSVCVAEIAAAYLGDPAAPVASSCVKDIPRFSFYKLSQDASASGL